MKLVCISLVLFFALGLAGKCDQYIRGAVYIHKSQANDEGGYYWGCRKGCFYNSTVTEDGAEKCEKCSNIEDEELCRKNTRGCHWTKGGKCGSASCSQIGKVYGKDVGNRNPLWIKRCIEGDDEEQYYNNLYLNEWVMKNNPDTDIPHYIRSQYSTPGYNRPCEPYRRVCEMEFNQTRYDLLVSNTLTAANSDPEYWTYKFRKSANAVADKWRADGLKVCKDDYETCVSGCNGGGVVMEAVNHAGVAAQRKSCHVISGCMYSKSNNRCSVWAVWAFVLVLVILILVALVAVGVVCFLVLSQLKNSSGGRGKPVKVSDSVSSGGGGGGGRPAEASDGGGGDEGKPAEVSDVSS